jgi:hypothetical protein
MFAAASFASSPTIWVSTFVGICVCLSRARVFRARTGRDAWGMPVWMWALLGFLFGLLGAVLSLIATRKSAIEKASRTMTAQGSFSPLGSPGSAAPGWYPSPDNTYEQMYWDGAKWVSRAQWNGNSWVPVPDS